MEEEKDNLGSPNVRDITVIIITNLLIYLKEMAGIEEGQTEQVES